MATGWTKYTDIATTVQRGSICAVGEMSDRIGISPIPHDFFGAALDIAPLPQSRHCVFADSNSQCDLFCFRVSPLDDIHITEAHIR